MAPSARLWEKRLEGGLTAGHSEERRAEASRECPRLRSRGAVRQCQKNVSMAMAAAQGQVQSHVVNPKTVELVNKLGAYKGLAESRGEQFAVYSTTPCGPQGLAGRRTLSEARAMLPTAGRQHLARYIDRAVVFLRDPVVSRLRIEVGHTAAATVLPALRGCV